MLRSCQEVIVTTPHATAAFVASRAGAMVTKTNHRLLGIVENMAYFESKVTGEKESVFGSGGGERLSEAIKTDILAKIPLNRIRSCSSSITGTRLMDVCRARSSRSIKKMLFSP
jgi:ATP-binding protein involved in chromosome partitioning